jgi:hypothetical protein
MPARSTSRSCPGFCSDCCLMVILLGLWAVRTPSPVRTASRTSPFLSCGPVAACGECLLSSPYDHRCTGSPPNTAAPTLNWKQAICFERLGDPPLHHHKPIRMHRLDQCFTCRHKRLQYRFCDCASNHQPAGQRDGHSRPNRHFLCKRNWGGSTRLPMAKERHRRRRRHVFNLHNTGHSAFRYWSAIYCRRQQLGGERDQQRRHSDGH